MTTTDAHLAFDLGAESGRAIMAVLTGEEGHERIELTQIDRFDNTPLTQNTDLLWDIEHLRRSLVNGLRAAGGFCERSSLTLRSVGVDTWGVDYGLMDSSGLLLRLPRTYRDPRHKMGFDALAAKLAPEARYAITGIQPMHINTLSQLAGHFAQSPGEFARADRLMMIPDLLHHILSGVVRTERTIASTTELLEVGKGTPHWSSSIIKKVGLPRAIFGPITEPGTALGPLTADVGTRAGIENYQNVQVVLPASHDTASAVAAVPAEPESSFAYISSGTWSLMGVELAAPILSTGAFVAGFTNEHGLGGSIRFLRNLIGLYMVQELRRDFRARGRTLNYTDLTEAAAASPPFRSRLDAGHAALAVAGPPGHMTEKIQAFASVKGDPVPETPGELVRCALESLAMAYRQTLRSLEALTDRRIDVIHIVGGGSRNALLCQMTADATNCRVLAGPVEATAAGNALVQAMGLGRVKDAAHLRRIVAGSFPADEYTPREPEAWDRFEGG